MRLLLSSILLFLVGLVQAESVPSLIHYQGTLTDSNGDPLADSSRTLKFNIYDALINGNLVWGPFEAKDVPIVEGKFNVILGPTDENKPNRRSIIEAFKGSSRYLGITIGDGEEIAPRQQIMSSPFAVQAAYATHAIHGVPVGAIMSFYGVEAPEGWLLCDGRPLDDPSLADPRYAALKAHLEKQKLSTLPDLRGRVLVSADVRKDAFRLGQIGGSETSQLTLDQLPKHSHGYGDIFWSEHYGAVATPDSIGSNSETDRDNKGLEMARTTGDSGNSAPFTNMPPYMAVSHIIKY